MPVTSIDTDPETLTITVVADVDAPVERLWAAYADPRKLERFWGPPGYPSTFLRHELTPGTVSHYAMTSPQGEKHHGIWRIESVDPGAGFVVVDSFADAEGTADPDLPGMRIAFSFLPTASGARMVSVSTFDSLEALEQVVQMGVLEGTRLALGQLDAVLADLREYALGKGTQTEILDDCHVKITRAFAAPLELIWRAHTDPELMKRWMLGPDGWRLAVCEFEPVAATDYRFGWEPVGDTEGEAFGFDGGVLVVDPMRRLVQTEHMTGTDFPSTTNDLGFVEADGVTLLTLSIEYPDAATRDMVLATGMTDGMEASYARLERELLPA